MISANAVNRSGSYCYHFPGGLQIADVPAITWRARIGQQPPCDAELSFWRQGTQNGEPHVVADVADLSVLHKRLRQRVRHLACQPAPCDPSAKEEPANVRYTAHCHTRCRPGYPGALSAGEPGGGLGGCGR